MAAPTIKGDGAHLEPGSPYTQLWYLRPHLLAAGQRQRKSSMGPTQGSHWQSSQEHRLQSMAPIPHPHPHPSSGERRQGDKVRRSWLLRELAPTGRGGLGHR